MRTLPWTDVDGLIGELEAYARDQLVPEMSKVAAESSITFTRVGDLPALDTDEGAPLALYVQAVLRNRARPGGLGFVTEGGLFQRAGIPTVICGPGSMDQGHKADEYVALGQLAECERFMQRLADTAFTE